MRSAHYIRYLRFYPDLFILISYSETCLNQTLSKPKTCLSQTLSKPKICLSQTDLQSLLLNVFVIWICVNKGNNRITELRTILQRESQNS